MSRPLPSDIHAIRRGLLVTCYAQATDDGLRDRPPGADHTPDDEGTDEDEPADEEQTTESAPDAEVEKEKAEKEQEIDWEEILLNGFEVGGQREQFESLEYAEPVTVETKDLIDHLREQLQMLTLSPRQLLLAEEFLGNLRAALDVI